MLNEYVWKLYLQSGGEETVDFFQKNLTVNMGKEYAERIKQLQNVYSVLDLSEDTYEQLCELSERMFQSWNMLLLMEMAFMKTRRQSKKN